MKRLFIHYLVAYIILTLYGGRVCPFIESLSLFQWASITFVSLTISLVIHVSYLIKRSFEDDLEKGTLLSFVLALVIFMFSAFLIGAFNTVYHNFHFTSGMKLIFGWLLVGVFINIDLALTRRFDMMMYLEGNNRHLDIQESYESFISRFSWVAISVFTSIIGMIFLLVVKDLDWFIHTVQTPHEAMVSILKEFLFIFLIIIGYIFLITSAYSRNLKYYLNRQNNALDRVVGGDLKAVVPVNSRDEFGWMAKQTNKMIDSLREQTESLQLTQDASILSLASLAETRDNETGAHIMRTQRYVKILAEELQKQPQYSSELTDCVIDLIYKSAPLHDMGKVGIPDHILLKPGKLTDDEFKVMKRHPYLGKRALVTAMKALGENSFMKYAEEIAFTHHEKWNGSGYPRKLKGVEIPLSGRLMAVADVYDALISKRVYKGAMSHEEARSIIINDSGSHFDPDVVDAFISVENEFIRIAKEFSDQNYKLNMAG